MGGFRPVVTENNLLVAQKCAFRDALLPAEPEDVRLRRHAPGHFRIVRVQNREITLELIFEKPHLRGGVIGER